MTAVEHYFAFSRVWRDGKRLCGECHLTYDEGAHTEITVLKAYTKYVCPGASDPTGGRGHSSTWTGAYIPELRRLDDDKCSCGATFVEEDDEQWRLAFEIQTPVHPEWHPVTVVRSKHAALQQQAGLLELIDQGEPIRNVVLEQVAS